MVYKIITVNHLLVMAGNHLQISLISELHGIYSFLLWEGIGN